MQQIFKAFIFSLFITQIALAGSGQIVSLLTLDDAVRKIIEQDNFKVLATKTEPENGRQVHIIKVLTPDGRIQYIKVDAETGAIVK